MKTRFIILVFCLWLAVSSAHGIVEGYPVPDALSLAEPYLKAGYMLSADTHDGTLRVGESSTATCQLFRGVQYVFVAGTEIKGSKVSIHIQDESGASVESKAWQQDGKAGTGCAGACAEITRTGRYRVVVKLESCPEPTAQWSLSYAQR